MIRTILRCPSNCVIVPAEMVINNFDEEDLYNRKNEAVDYVSKKCKNCMIHVSYEILLEDSKILCEMVGSMNGQKSFYS